MIPFSSFLFCFIVIITIFIIYPIVINMYFFSLSNSFHVPLCHINKKIFLFIYIHFSPYIHIIYIVTIIVLINFTIIIIISIMVIMIIIINYYYYYY